MQSKVVFVFARLSGASEGRSCADEAYFVPRLKKGMVRLCLVIRFRAQGRMQLRAFRLGRLSRRLLGTLALGKAATVA